MDATELAFGCVTSLLRKTESGRGHWNHRALPNLHSGDFEQLDGYTCLYVHSKTHSYIIVNSYIRVSSNSDVLV